MNKITRPKRIKGERKAIALNQMTELVHFSRLLPETELFLLAQPSVKGVNLAEWVANNAQRVVELIHRHGVVLFRGFGLNSDEDFSSISDALPFERLDAEIFEESTPRSKAAPGIYTTTHFPKEESIALHSDYSPSMCLAEKLAFFCLLPAQSGGRTPFADTRKILKKIEPDIAQKFRRLGWRLVRNYRKELGLAWQDTFYGKSKEAIEQHCRENHIDLQWIGQTPRTIQSRAAIIVHPKTNEEAWFNHVAFWHIANLPQAMRETMLGEVGVEGMPFHTYYGDGSEISDEIAHHLRDVLEAEKHSFEWQRGDLILADNILTCHGRDPYRGDRTVRVSLYEKHIRESFSII